jgi:hypothetical protein
VSAVAIMRQSRIITGQNGVYRDQFDREAKSRQRLEAVLLTFF